MKAIDRTKKNIPSFSNEELQQLIHAIEDELIIRDVAHQPSVFDLDADSEHERNFINADRFSDTY